MCSQVEPIKKGAKAESKPPPKDKKDDDDGEESSAKGKDRDAKGKADKTKDKAKDKAKKARKDGDDDSSSSAGSKSLSAFKKRKDSSVRFYLSGLTGSQFGSDIAIHLNLAHSLTPHRRRMVRTPSVNLCSRQSR